MRRRRMGEDEGDPEELLKTFPDITYLSVTKRHVGTQTADVRLARIVQLRFQTDVLRLRHEDRL